MKTKLFLSNGRHYEVELSLKDLVNEHLHDEEGHLKNEMVHFEAFSINPTQIVALEEIDDSETKRIGY